MQVSPRMKLADINEEEMNTDIMSTFNGSTTPSIK